MYLEGLEVPTVTFVTVPFEGYGRLRATSLGIPALPLVVVDHPLADRSHPEIEEIAEGCVCEVVAALTTTDDSSRP